MYEGKEIKYRFFNDEVIPAIVVGCDFDIGITIVAKEDSTNRLTCIRGRSTKYWPKDELFYDDMYKESIKMIKDGIYNVANTLPFIERKWPEVLEERSDEIARCAFE